MVRRGLAVGAAGLLSVSVFGVQQAVARADGRATGKPGVATVDAPCVARDSLTARLGEPHRVRGRWVVDSVGVQGDFSGCREAPALVVEVLGRRDRILAEGRGRVAEPTFNAGVDLALDRPVDGENLSALRVTVHR